MSDVIRILDASESETERLLLRAGRAGAPPRAQERALLAATGVLAASSLAAGSVAAGNAAVGAKASSLAALGSLKWLVLVGVVGAGTAAGTIAVRRATSSSTIAAVGPSAAPANSQRAPSPSRTVRPVESGLAPAAAPVASATQAAAREPRAAPNVAPVASPPPSFSAELNALDSARRAIDVGESRRALAILEGYRARFPNGAMGPEATILRIEALEKAGDHAAAVRSASAFLGSDPASPYAARVRSLVGRIDDRREEGEPLTPEPRSIP